MQYPEPSTEDMKDAGAPFACLLLLIIFPSVECTTCLKCDNVIKPSLCKDVEQCGPHEVCQTEAFVTPSGSIIYKLGCVDSLFCVSPPITGKRNIKGGIETTNLSQLKGLALDRDKKALKFCSECCTGNLCNAGGCGNQGFDPNLGPVCYSCPTQVGPGGCEHIQQCGRDKICMINPITIAGQRDTYTSSCEHQRDCQSIRLPTGGGLYACSACCDDTLCNFFNTSTDVCMYQSNQMTSTTHAYSSLSTSPQPTTVTTSTASTTHLSCDICNRFHPDIICGTGTTFVQQCIQHCGFNCPS